jgi:hypothetical protein
VTGESTFGFHGRLLNFYSFIHYHFLRKKSSPWFLLVIWLSYAMEIHCSPRSVSLGAEWPEEKADHSSLSAASAAPYIFSSWCSVQGQLCTSSFTQPQCYLTHCKVRMWAERHPLLELSLGPLRSWNRESSIIEVLRRIYANSPLSDLTHFCSSCYFCALSCLSFPSSSGFYPCRFSECSIAALSAAFVHLFPPLCPFFFFCIIQFLRR